MKIAINLYTKTSLHQSESTLLAVEVVERFAEGHASVELQLLGAFCQSEVGKGWLVSGRRGGTWNMIFFFCKKDGCEGDDDDDDDDDDDGKRFLENVEVDMKMIIQEDGWVTPKILRGGLVGIIDILKLL